ncbi:GtrA-like protein [Paucimonas lemoignei]|uniref:GtrA-like protein n=1 Tax=Paucimonas lemoignei TaxID=29443 RepID=A0A4R3HTH8_PAULE|nr:GtrA family protein [Paucimonas lemoignei]TCS35119.1 GtrA-like protein [Paucimonas lemoignei]
MTNFRSINLGNLAKHQFLRFLFVGMINSLFGYGCFALFLYLGLHYTLALLLATALGVLFNFKTTGTLVFGSRDNRLVFRFSCSYIFIYFINVIGIKALSLIGIEAYIAGAILLLPMAVLAFIVNKWFVFNYG